MTQGYIVMTATAHLSSSMRSKVRSPYKRVAVCQVEDIAQPPAMISPRAKGLIRIVKTWENLNIGTTERSAFYRALAEAKAVAAHLNAGGEV